MFRIGLVSYLVLATLGGPVWCCCTLSRVAHAVTRVLDKTDSAPVRTCCQHRLQTKQQNPSKDKAVPSQNDPCPCKEQRSNHVVALAPQATIAEHARLSSLAYELAQPIALGFMLHNGEPNIAHVGFSSCAFHSSGPDLLCALQVFRC